MKLFCLLWVLLALALHQVKGQDDATADAGDADTAAPGAPEGEDKEECEESWEYIEFLRGISDQSEGILESIRDQKNLVGDALTLQNVIRDTMSEVLNIRSGINDRIFQIRKEEITICPDQNIQQESNLDNLRMEIMGILLQLVDKNTTPEELKEIGNALLTFRGKVNTEIMRVLMIPQGQTPIPIDAGDCTECDILEQIRDKINGVIDCANAAEDESDADTDADAGAAPSAGAGADGAEGECMPPPMYFMDIMECNRMIDDYTEAQFQKLFQSMDESERSKIESSLTQMKDIREMLEQTIQKLARTAGDDRIKKVVISGLREPLDTLEDQIKDCLEQCGQSSCEDSCGYQELVKIRDLIQSIKEDYQKEGADFEQVKDESRRTVMGYISGANKEMNEIITRKVRNDNMLEDCDKEKLNVFNQTKPPMWMLVNATIFAEGPEGPITLIDALVEIVNGSIENYCSDEGPTPAPVRQENCKLAEYEKIAEYVEKIDEIIQEKLFKPTEDNAKVEAQLGFLEIKQMFDARIEELFNGDVKCGEELEVLKKSWMPQLNKCMAEFMNQRRTFTEMSRIERIQCTKDLRGAMETRRADLLKMELDSIQNGGDSEDGSQ